jgi:hypothetical protein
MARLAGDAENFALPIEPGELVAARAGGPVSQNAIGRRRKATSSRLRTEANSLLVSPTGVAAR